MTGARTRIAALMGAALMGAIIAVTVQGGAAAPAAPPPPPVTTTTVARTDLSSSVLTGGTLGYAPAAPVVNELGGTYTEVPAGGRRIGAGGVLYRVDNAPIVLMAGRIPAWRALALGVTDGPDIAELQANLIALGYAGGLLSAPTGYFDVLTYDAVRRWQLAAGDPVTGEIPLGGIVFLPSPIRVGTASLAPGQAASPGQEPYQATTIKRTVVVALNPTLPAVHVGEAVPIILPSGATVAGRATLIGSTSMTVTPSRSADTGTGAGIPVEVSLTTQSVRHVLVVPVSALLALAGGGYALEVVEASGAHRLVRVSTGAFGGSRVQVSGAEIAPGTRVVVAQ